MTDIRALVGFRRMGCGKGLGARVLLRNRGHKSDVAWGPRSTRYVEFRRGKRLPVFLMRWELTAPTSSPSKL